MSNMFNLFEEYEKRYNTWLKNSAVPKAQSWYTGSHLEKNLGETKDYLWGTSPTDSQAGTRGLLGVDATPMAGFNKKSLESFQSSRAADALLGAKIGYGRGKVDPPLAAAVKSQYGWQQKMFDVEGRVGSTWTRKGIDLYNRVASEHFSRFAIRDKNGKIVRRDGKIQLNNKGKAQLDSAAAAFDKEQNLDLAEGGQGGKFTEQDANSLSKFAGVNLKDVKKNWAKKGGFDGLMANPAFTLGLALMQSSAEGKSVGSGLLDNFVKSAGLSEHYQDRLKARRNIMGPVSDDQRAMAASALPTGVQSPGLVEELFGDGDKLRGHNSALNKIHREVRKQFKAKDWDYSKGEPVMTEEMYNKAYNKLLKEKKIFNEVLSNQFHDVVNYSLGVSFNPLGKNRMSTNPKYEFYYDMIEWLNKNNVNLPLSRFRLTSKAEIEFRYSEDQYNFIQDQLERFDNNIVATSKALFATTSIPSHYFWRKPFVGNKSTANI